MHAPKTPRQKSQVFSFLFTGIASSKTIIREYWHLEEKSFHCHLKEAFKIKANSLDGAEN